MQRSTKKKNESLNQVVIVNGTHHSVRKAQVPVIFEKVFW